MLKLEKYVQEKLVRVYVNDKVLGCVCLTISAKDELVVLNEVKWDEI